MFGLNDDKAAAEQRPHESHGDQPAHHDNPSDNASSDSPFAAAYSSLTSSDNDDEQTDTPTPATDPVSSVPEEDLLHIKTQALQSLAPLVNHLDQSPEERFKTTMMMIQASDNADLIRDAYEAASRIENEKTRAQALLDVVNEINYFTQRGKN